MVITAGMIIPPPTPCRTRKAISEPALQASAQSIEPSRNRTSDER
jgi:hypothetical protein